MKIRLKFEPRDIWTGVFIDTKNDRLYICVIPMFPIVIHLSERPFPL